MTNAKEKNTLILTGWHYPEYMASAAAMLAACGDPACVLGVSMAALAATLEDRGADYSEIHVLGVGLDADPDRLGRALKELKARGIAVNWYSRQPMPPEVEQALKAVGGSFARTMVGEDSDTLLDVLEDQGQTKNVDSRIVERLKPLAATDPKVVPKDCSGLDLTKVKVWAALFKAAGFVHRQEGDEQACEYVVRALLRQLQGKDLKRSDERLSNMFDALLWGGTGELVGRSAVMKELRERLRQAGECGQACVLLLGESGAGKQLAAEKIHKCSRRKGSFVAFNCAYGGGGDDMLRDALFGHEKGAFTGAVGERKGLFESADGGTLFLDEIGELSPQLQGLLLKVVEDGKIVRLGGDPANPMKVNVRLICATNRDIQQMALRPRGEPGSFMFDLYQRLAAIVVRLPALREHKEDIPAIASSFWFPVKGRSLTSKQTAALKDYSYPGNVRELCNILLFAKAIDESDFGKVLAEYRKMHKTLIDGMEARFRGEGSLAAAPKEELPDSKDEMLHRWARTVLDRHGQNITAAAKAAGCSKNAFKKYLAGEEAAG